MKTIWITKLAAVSVASALPGWLKYFCEQPCRVHLLFLFITFAYIKLQTAVAGSKNLTAEQFGWPTWRIRTFAVATQNLLCPYCCAKFNLCTCQLTNTKLLGHQLHSSVNHKFYSTGRIRNPKQLSACVCIWHLWKVTFGLIGSHSLSHSVKALCANSLCWYLS